MAYTTICSSCGHALHNDFHFCPGCGKAITNKALSTSLSKQIFIYVVSFCFAPFGLRWVLPYMREKTLSGKLIGVTALILTLTSISIALFTALHVGTYYSKMLNGLDDPNKYLQQYGSK